MRIEVEPRRGIRSGLGGCLVIDERLESATRCGRRRRALVGDADGDREAFENHLVVRVGGSGPFDPHDAAILERARRPLARGSNRADARRIDTHRLAADRLPRRAPAQDRRAAQQYLGGGVTVDERVEVRDDLERFGGLGVNRRQAPYEFLHLRRRLEWTSAPP